MSAWSFIAILVTVLAVAYAVDSMHAREAANRFVAQLCRRHAVQFLEGTVVHQGARPRSGARGLKIRRTYHFEYCPDNVSRRSGFIVLDGREVSAFGLDPDARREE